MIPLKLQWYISWGIKVGKVKSVTKKIEKFSAKMSSPLTIAGTKTGKYIFNRVNEEKGGSLSTNLKEVKRMKEERKKRELKHGGPKGVKKVIRNVLGI